MDISIWLRSARLGSDVGELFSLVAHSNQSIQSSSGDIAFFERHCQCPDFNEYLYMAEFCSCKQRDCWVVWSARLRQAGRSSSKSNPLCLELDNRADILPTGMS